MKAGEPNGSDQLHRQVEPEVLCGHQTPVCKLAWIEMIGEVVTNSATGS